MLRTLVISTIIGSAMLTGQFVTGAEDPLGKYPPGYTATGPNGYVYVAPQQLPAPPAYVAPPLHGFGAAWYGSPLPPIGFGSPYYNGYSDPNYPLYGPGVREFLDFGGADFYGW